MKRAIYNGYVYTPRLSAVSLSTFGTLASVVMIRRAGWLEAMLWRIFRREPAP